MGRFSPGLVVVLAALLVSAPLRAQERASIAGQVLEVGSIVAALR
jgi:hypothetical protein